MCRFLGDQQLGFGLQQIKWGVTPLVAEEQECAGKPAECGATLITLVVGIAKQIPRNWYGCRLWWFRMLKTGLRLEHTNEHPWDQALPRQQALIPVWAGGHYVLSACCVPYSPSLRPFSSLEGLLEGLPALASTQHIVGYHNGSRGWSPCLCLGTRICVNGKQDLTRS